MFFLLTVLSILVVFPKMRKGSQFQSKIKFLNHSKFSLLNLPLVLVHMLTDTAVIKVAANPTETITDLKDTEESEKKNKNVNLLNINPDFFVPMIEQRKTDS